MDDNARVFDEITRNLEVEDDRSQNNIQLVQSNQTRQNRISIFQG